MTRLVIAVVLASALAVPVGAQMTAEGQVPAAGPQTGLTPVPDSEKIVGHFHNGSLGQKYLLIEQSLRCNCGCGLDVHSCQFQMQCGTSPAWSEYIRDQLNAGQSPDVIKASFVSEFGETVLMAPPARGFNLVGYLLPGFAIIAAGALVGLVIRGGATRHPQPVTIAPEELSPEDQARLDAALKRLEQSESPDW
ncbi:MAG: cytochrome c-type biogenesis protein CcmH [Gemmatimonadetes bacterium]|nr:cytochrome c-type biogenesis protein CcmH [Gemmatimonadota bacterium]